MTVIERNANGCRTPDDFDGGIQSVSHSLPSRRHGEHRGEREEEKRGLRRRTKRIGRATWLKSPRLASCVSLSRPLGEPGRSHCMHCSFARRRRSIFQLFLLSVFSVISVVKIFLLHLDSGNWTLFCWILEEDLCCRPCFENLTPMRVHHHTGSGRCGGQWMHRALF